MITIRPAVWPRDIANAQSLLRSYLHFLQHNPAGPVEICSSGFESELASLQTRYIEPNAVLLLACEQDAATGCVAVQLRHDRPSACEMKRLWTEPSHRGKGVGKMLIHGAVDWARAHGADELLLDTVAAAMPDALRLYRSLGFVETERHNANAVAGLLFLKLQLR